MLYRTLSYALLFAGTVWGQPAVPSTWEGRATGSIRGVRFDIPVTIELKAALPWEKNPFHLFLGTISAKRVGDFGLMSANEVATGGPVKTYETGRYGVGVYDRTVTQRAGRGNVTLQYLTVKVDGNAVTAVLTETQAEAAAAANVFTGPNVSAQEASDLMRGVMEQLGPTEMFVFARGASVRLQFGGDGLTGTVTGKGGSVLGTSSLVLYECALRAKRVK